MALTQIVPVDDGNVGYAVQLGSELVSKSIFGSAGPAFDWQYTLRTTRHAASHPDYFIRLAQDDDGTYTGFVGGHVMHFFFSPATMCIEDAWFVREGAAGRTKTALTLMRAMMKWAFEEKNVVLMQSGDIASISSLAVDAMYRGLGFKRFGTMYKYEKTDERSAA